MKLLLAALIFSAVSAFAAPNLIETKSPSGRYAIRFSQESERDNYQATVISADGLELFSFKAGLSISKKSILWNDSGTILAFASGAHFLTECFLLFIQNDQWTVAKVPTPERGWDNFHQVPISWKKDLLSLRVDGPYAGKSDGYHYSGVMKIRISGTQPRISVFSENINTVEQDAAANP